MKTIIKVSQLFGCWLIFQAYFDVDVKLNIFVMILYVVYQSYTLYGLMYSPQQPYQPQPLYLTIPVQLAHITLPQGVIIKYSVLQPPIHIHSD